jgi:hypothetical protein
MSLDTVISFSAPLERLGLALFATTDAKLLKKESLHFVVANAVPRTPDRILRAESGERRADKGQRA